jgi:hypothetical protein
MKRSVTMAKTQEECVGCVQNLFSPAGNWKRIESILQKLMDLLDLYAGNATGISAAHS